MSNDFSKQFFQKAWGEEGYYEKFSYGLGFNKTISVALLPFLSKEKVVLEIGSGGGTFTEVIVGKVKHLTAIDVIKAPKKYSSYPNFNYIELSDQDYSCTGMAANNFDMAFCYNVFCHLSNKALKEYINVGVYKVLKDGADFVFMIADFKHSSLHFPDTASDYKREDNLLTPIGHFHQDEKTIGDVVDLSKWEIVSENMLPGHRDIVIHLKKKGSIMVVGEDMICPATGNHCDDEVCAVGSECNVSGTGLEAIIQPDTQPVLSMYSQNNEQEIILNYFKGRSGTLLDIGANDGITLSNTHALMLLGWKGVLVEPSPKAFKRMSILYERNENSSCVQLAIGAENKDVSFHESGGYQNGPDVSLLSCVDAKEKLRWGNTVEFEEITVKMVTFDELQAHTTIKPPYHFISIDAEGLDYEILGQIDLNDVGCECFIVEHNSLPVAMNLFREIASKFGFKEIGFNAENLIFAK